MKHIATQYEKALIKIASYADHFAYGPNPAREILSQVAEEIELAARHGTTFKTR